MTQRKLEMTLPTSDERLQTHWALQVVSAAGATLAPAKADYSHTALGWDPRAQRFVGAKLGAHNSMLGFDPSRGQLLLVGADGRVEQAAELDGRTLQESLDLASDWLDSRLMRPEHELPDHPVANGATFEFDDSSAIASWFTHAEASLRHAIRALPSDLDLWLWPHHFDLAALWTLGEGGGSGEGMRSVGLGFSPGDGSYAEPYFYVSPWPYPPQDALPPLGTGHWHTDGFTAAVLTATDVQASAAPDEAQGFLQAAASTCRDLVQEA